MGQLTLVLGGVRSGKSRFAEQKARAYPCVTYLATAQAGDAEMEHRIALHRQRREGYVPPWLTIEEPWQVVRAVRDWQEVCKTHSSESCLILECVTLWLTNLLVGLPGKPPLTDDRILAEVNELTGSCVAGSGSMIVVSNETGLGIMPANKLSRRFGDLLGEANQRLARYGNGCSPVCSGHPFANEVKQWFTNL